ncbi:hypothetical protein Gotri_007575 [Gossypium trilobum]|uniref:Uncharacterized protein n=1 Tax=Gossypium trilobum TaxID=34281 RepID=A0A7J9EGK4_9ROSI|nr:hypothetical protein [Gossypium trilobum]
MVVAEDVSHKEDGQSRHCNFPYYDQFTSIYAKDRATGKDAQTTGNIVEEINVEDLHNHNRRSQTKMIPHFQRRKKTNL